jgi:competence protein ComEC
MSDRSVVVWLIVMLFFALLVVKFRLQRLCIAGVLLFFVGLSYMNWRYPRMPPIDPSSGAVAGSVAQVISGTPTSSQLLLKQVSVNGKKLGGKIQVAVGGSQSIGAGDRLKLNGELNPLPATLAHPDLRGEMRYPKLESDKRAKDSRLDELRSGFIGRIEQILPQPESGFLAGLLVGDESGMGPDLRTALKRTGTTHLVAVSGYNLSVIASVLLLMRGRLPLRIVYTGAFAFVVVFTVFVGSSASVVRAAIMACIVLAGKMLFLRADVGRLVLIAAVLMVVWDPRALLGDVGGQLSFLATAGIVWIEPRLRPMLAWLPGGLAELVSVTLAAQLATEPLIVGIFGRTSLVALPLNSLIIPMIPLAMLLGFVALGTGVIFAPAGNAVGILAWAVLHFILTTIDWAANIPSGSLLLSGTAQWFVVAVATGICLLLLLLKPRASPYELV